MVSLRGYDWLLQTDLMFGLWLRRALKKIKKHKNDLNLDFRIFKGRCYSNQLSFSAMSCLRRNPKTTRDWHMISGKENIGNFVFCRMAPSVMTAGDPECKNCFRFVQVLRVRFAQKVRDQSSPFFSAAGSATGVDDCREIGLRSLEGRCHGRRAVCRGHSTR